MSTHKLQLATVPFDAILSGIKTIESRLYDEKTPDNPTWRYYHIYESRKHDQTVTVKVIGLLCYETLHDLSAHNNPVKFGGESVE